MIKVKISGFDVTGILDFFKKYDGFDELNWMNEWILCSSGDSDQESKLFVFIYTNYMMRIKSNLTVSVMLEFHSKSEANATIISTGGKEGLLEIGYGAEEHCEKKIYDALKETAMASELIVKDDFGK